MTHPVVKSHEEEGRRAIMRETDTHWRIVKFQEWDPLRKVWLDVESSEHMSSIGANPAYDSILQRRFPDTFRVPVQRLTEANQAQARRILHLTVLALGCSKHPAYRVKRAPKTDCDCCSKMWQSHLALQEMAEKDGATLG